MTTMPGSDAVRGRAAVTLIALLATLAAPPVAAQQTPESRFFESDGVRLHYVDVGRGEPVLLLHGLAVSLDLNFAQPGIISALREAGYHVIAYDSRGHGLSDKPHDPRMYGRPEVEDAVRILDHLEIPRAHVVGYSRGGLIADRLRARHPDRLLTVTLGGYGRGAPEPGQAAGMAAVADSLAEGNFRPLLRLVHPDASPEETRELARMLAETDDGEAVAAAMRAGASFPPLPEGDSGGDAVPMLAVLAERDPFRPQVERMRERMTGLETLVIPDADHVSAIGRPELVTAILGFLARHPAPEPGGR